MKKWFLPILCALPFVGVLLWFIAGKNVNNLVSLGLFLACPLMHLFFMKHNHGETNDTKRVYPEESSTKGGENNHGKK